LNFQTVPQPQQSHSNQSKQPLSRLPLTFLNENIIHEPEEIEIINNYLRHYFLFQNKGIEDFELYLSKDIIKIEYFNACVLRGEETDEVLRSLGNSNYGLLVKKTQLT